ncbi:MAG: hypothetical protein AAF661_12620 [Pseudomonadota bacterium]
MHRSLSAFVAIALLTGAAAFATPVAAQSTTEEVDPRVGDPSYERAQRLFGIVREILDNAARMRLGQQIDPDGPVVDFLKRQVGMDRQTRAQQLLGSAFEMITDTPVVAIQERIAKSRADIATMQEQIAELKERRVSAPESAGWEGWVGLAEDQATIDSAIRTLEERIAGAEERIEGAKEDFATAMSEAGAPLPADQVDLLLESVTGGDLIELAAAYEATRGISKQLRQLMEDSGEDLVFARRYYGMHTALIALLVEAQTQFLDQIDDDYLPKLKAIERDILDTERQTDRLLADDPTDAQYRALKANKESQRIAKEALRLYREYLMGQRQQVAEARERTVKELRVADNTLRTVNASFQLRQVMENAASSFEALQSLESPGFDRVFRNEELRREFQELTEKLAPGS